MKREDIVPYCAICGRTERPNLVSRQLPDDEGRVVVFDCTVCGHTASEAAVEAAEVYEPSFLAYRPDYANKIDLDQDSDAEPAG